MAVSDSYRDFVLEQLGRVMPVTGKSMFGGMGLYAEGLFFALIAEDRLYFKVDDTTRSDFERLGMEPLESGARRGYQGAELTGQALESAHHRARPQEDSPTHRRQAEASGVERRDVR
jgi:TfoX/Sxy family transcriptional regulator of competence genes